MKENKNEKIENLVSFKDDTGKESEKETIKISDGYKFRFILTLILAFILLFIGSIIIVSKNQPMANLQSENQLLKNNITELLESSKAKIAKLEKENTNMANDLILKQNEINSLKKDITKLNKELIEKNSINDNLLRIIDMQKLSLLIQYRTTNSDIISDLFIKEAEGQTLINMIESSYSEKIFFKFKGGKNIKVSEDGLTATKVGENSREGADLIGDKVLIKNRINRWKIKIIKDNEGEGSIDIGISPSDIDLNVLDNYKKNWFFAASRPMFYAKDRPKQYGVKVHEGDVVEVIADLIKGTLSFKVNDIYLGVACDKIPLDIDLVPFAEMYYMDKNEIKIVN